jgi:hypothetical protein
MATRKPTAHRRPPVDRHGTNPTAAEASAALTARCETGRHPACKGQVVSLLYVGPCRCRCHQADPAGRGAA